MYQKRCTSLYYRSSLQRISDCIIISIKTFFIFTIVMLGTKLCIYRYVLKKMYLPFILQVFSTKNIRVLTLIVITIRVYFSLLIQKLQLKYYLFNFRNIQKRVKSQTLNLYKLMIFYKDDLIFFIFFFTSQMDF